MRWSRLYIPTLRDDPAEAEVESHKLLLRAGYVRQLSAGLYCYLYLAKRSLNKIEQVVREEMDAIGAQEIYTPELHPAEIWKESGRWDSIGDDMFRLEDRWGRELCLGMTEEEVVTFIARGELRSYRQLPQIWYQIQAKFRDEPRPKSGLMRVRRFTMKDSYTFDMDSAGLDAAGAQTLAVLLALDGVLGCAGATLLLRARHGPPPRRLWRIAARHVGFVPAPALFWLQMKAFHAASQWSFATTAAAG